MANLNTLEARVAAATQSLVGQQGHAQELQGRVLRLDDELTRSRADIARLQGDLAKTSEEKSKLEEKAEQLGGENRRLIGETTRFREEISRLEGEGADLRQERDRLVGLLDSLVQAVENHRADKASREAAGSTADVVELSSPLGEVCPLPAGEASAEEPGWLALGSAQPQLAKIDPDSDIPNEAARRLMDRIRDRIEAHRV